MVSVHATPAPFFYVEVKVFYFIKGSTGDKGLIIRIAAQKILKLAQVVTRLRASHSDVGSGSRQRSIKG